MRIKPKNIALNAFIIILAIIVAFPLFWMLSVSFMAAGEASTFPPPLLPKQPQISAYHELFASSGLWKYLFNSIFLAICATLLSLTFNVTAGYAFAKLKFNRSVYD